MTPKIQDKRLLTWLGVTTMMTLAIAWQTRAATPLQARIVPRPLTPGDITAYQLPAGTETSGGLTTVGVGQPLYLEAEVNLAIPASDSQGRI